MRDNTNEVSLHPFPVRQPQCCLLCISTIKSTESPNYVLLIQSMYVYIYCRRMVQEMKEVTFKIIEKVIRVRDTIMTLKTCEYRVETQQ